MASSHSPNGGRYHNWVAGRPVLVLVLSLLVGAAGAFLASKLKLKTAFAELLPSDDPGVVALTRTQARMGDLSLLLIGVRSPDHDANLRYAEELTKRLREMPPTVVQLATYNVRDLKQFFEKNKWLYASEDDLESIRDRLRTEISKRKNPLFVSLGDEEPLEDMQKRMEHKDGLDERFPGGVFESNHGEYVWIAALPPGGLFADNAGEGLFKAAHRLLEEVPPESFHPKMRAEVSGPIATAIASREAVERDILWVTVTCLVVVALSIGLYFRRLRAIPLTGVPAMIGAMVAFGVAELAFGYLNSSTAFLGSIILGNGINYAIVVMSRYEEERARGASTDEALRAALAGTWRGTLVASICASAAYASLMVTSFRGFYQFGVMGAVGALFCWAATYTALPAMLVLLDRREKGRDVRGRAPLDLGPLARLLGRHGATVSAVIAVLAVTSLYGLTHFLKDPFEYDFRKLNAKLNTTEEAKEFGKSVDKLFGRWPSPTIVLADSVDEVEPIKKTIRAQDFAQAQRQPDPKAPGAEVIGQIVTIYDLLPGPPDVQERKLALIKDIDKLKHDKALSLLDDDEKKKLDKIDPPSDLRELKPLDLPPIARRPFTEVDGTVGRVVLVYPPEKGLSVWSGRDLLRIASVLQFLHLPEGKVVETSGSAVVFGAMIRSVLHDGPIATTVSLLAVLVLVLAMIRPVRAALVAVAILLLGVTLMVGSAGWARVHVTFLNFIALPITFGIGAEYVLNVVTRYREERDILRSVVSTGAAVALCSWTTIVGYGSLLAARNQALQGFGAMAILGEISCLSAAIVALPAFVIWSQGRRATNGASGRAQPAPGALGEPPVEPSSLSAPSASE
ncbi:MAG TPA: MMPL family transporter [Polyangia bacterium]|nr:MMPL family transporter [Polyangia bacterium]